MMGMSSDEAIQGAQDVRKLECGFRRDVGDGTYIQVWICPDSPESECVVLQHCYEDSTVITQNNVQLDWLGGDLILEFFDKVV